MITEIAAPEAEIVPFETPGAEDKPMAKPEPVNTKIGVTIATPMKYFPEEWPEKAEDKAKLYAQFLPPFVGQALRELAERKDPHFRREADKYVFTFMAVVGGMCRARNVATAEFLKSQDSFLIPMDGDLNSDKTFGSLADAILRLLSHRQPIVGGLYCRRARRPQWAVSWMPAATLAADNNKDGLIQVAELAGGCCCIHRKVFSELARIFGDQPLLTEPKGVSIRYRDRDSGEGIYGFYQNIVLDGDLLSEDYWFSYLCRCAKIALVADTKIRLRHVDPDSGTIYPPGVFPPIPAYDRKP